MKKKQILLPDRRYKKAPIEEQNLTVNLEEERKLLINGDRNVIVDYNELFDRERNNSIKYKVHGKIRMVFRNLYTGTTNYNYLKNRLYLNGFGLDGEAFEGTLPYNEFAFIRNDVSRQKPKVYSGDTLIGFDGFDLVDKIEDDHKVITEVSSPKYNWNVFLSYVNDQNEDYPMIYTSSGGSETLEFKSGDGIPFEISEDDNEYSLTSPVRHGMNEGEYIILEDRLYYISSVGNEDYNSEHYIVNILKSQIPTGVTTFNNTLITGKRCLDNTNTGRTTSSYYVHINKTLTGVNDHIVDKVGFESSIWEDEKKLLYQNFNNDEDVLVVKNRMENVFYDFKDPFILSGITNNLGYTPTDVYVTVLLKNSNGYFEYPPKVGHSFNFHNSWLDKHFSGTGSTENSLTYGTFNKLNSTGGTITFKYGKDLPIGSELVGSFIEYAPTEMNERIISPPFHKITNPIEIFNYGQTDDTRYTGASEENPFGLFYQSQYRVELRTLSPYVETSRNPDIYNLPDNAKFVDDKKYWKWRDLYDHGYIDDEGNGVNHPFLNNIHYVKRDINFFLRNEESFNIKNNGLDDFNNRILNC